MALASCSQSRCCRYQKKCVSNQNYCFCPPPEENCTSLCPESPSCPLPRLQHLTNRRPTWTAGLDPAFPALSSPAWGYFLLCIISSIPERGSGRNIPHFPAVELTFAAVECPSHPLHLHFGLQPHTSDLPAVMVLQK